MKLAELKCVACRGGDPALTEVEVSGLMLNVPQWQLVVRDGISQLQRVFKFKTYAQSLEFTNKIAVIAEEQDHHPLIVLEWGMVTIQWWTHVVKGLHRKISSWRRRRMS